MLKQQHTILVDTACNQGGRQQTILVDNSIHCTISLSSSYYKAGRTVTLNHLGVVSLG